MKYAMNLEAAIDFGKTFALEGWTKEKVENWISDCGYKVNGKAFKRIKKAYFSQISNN